MQIILVYIKLPTVAIANKPPTSSEIGGLFFLLHAGDELLVRCTNRYSSI
jgi:hypothetical protein